MKSQENQSLRKQLAEPDLIDDQIDGEGVQIGPGRAIPQAAFVKVEKPLKAAQLGKSAVKLDYVISLSYSQVNYVFRSDCTYLISGAVGLSGSATVFERNFHLKLRGKT